MKTADIKNKKEKPFINSSIDDEEFFKVNLYLTRHLFQL